MRVWRAVGVTSVFGGNFRPELGLSIGLSGMRFDVSCLWIR